MIKFRVKKTPKLRVIYVIRAASHKKALNVYVNDVGSGVPAHARSFTGAFAVHKT